MGCCAQWHRVQLHLAHVFFFLLILEWPFQSNLMLNAGCWHCQVKCCLVSFWRTRQRCKAGVYSFASDCDELHVEFSAVLTSMPAHIDAFAGLYFGARESSYFAVGKITQDQVHEYADRKKMARDEAEKWLNTMLSYEP